MTEANTDHATAARAMLHAARHGSLGTLAADHPGYPFVSVVAYALDEQTRPLLALSDLAEHAINLARDDRASLMVLEDAPDPIAAGRTTLLGRCARVADDEVEQVRATYLARHPNASFVRFGDFHLYRLEVEAVRYVGGFGRMSWVDAAQFARA